MQWLSTSRDPNSTAMRCASFRSERSSVARRSHYPSDHPFVDGNKRVAFQAMYVFLGLNGLRIDADEPDVVHTVLSSAAGELREPDLAESLRRHTTSR
ncbi:MAG: hypothetical protein EA426_04215 [Spirochaetaceae bacterium]|nr:MAG: hypothetical protein EA426_04215 [Spirochaetaceae bacterium]